MGSLSELPKGSETILLIDDEQPIRDVGMALLTKLGYNVLLADDGPMGIDMLSTDGESVDLVILDLSMPGMTGVDVIGRIHEMGLDTRIVVSSGCAEDELAERVAGTGVSGYIVKPFNLADLARVVRSALDGESQIL